MRWSVLTLILFAVSSCGPPLKGRPITINDLPILGITDPTLLGLPADFPLNAAPEKLVVSPDPILFETTTVGVAKTKSIILYNSHALINIELTHVGFTVGTGLTVLDGSCLYMPGNVLPPGYYCELILELLPMGSGPVSDHFEVDYNDGTAKTETALLTGTVN